MKVIAGGDAAASVTLSTSQSVGCGSSPGSHFIGHRRLTGASGAYELLVNPTLIRSLRRRVAYTVGALCISAIPTTAAAQTPASAVGLGFGVDTMLTDVGPIVRLVRAYLANPHAAARSSKFWESGPPGDHRFDDVAARFALQGAPASIIGVVPTDGSDSVYVVKLLHASGDSAGGPVAPIALERMYAVRRPGAPFGWRLAAALPRLTADWQSGTAGRITFYYAPGQEPDLERAARAASFVDSVAKLFNVAQAKHLEYYVTGSADEYFRAIGLDFFVQGSGPGQATGGNALPDVGVLLAGDPAQGEFYRHELVHLAVDGNIRSVFIAEGAAAWLGGSRGQDVSTLYRDLTAFQQAHPDVMFGRVIGDKLSASHDPVASADAWYASGALVCDAVFRRDGVNGLRALASASNDPAAVQRALARLLDIPDDPDALDRWWRSTAAAFSRAR